MFVCAAFGRARRVGFMEGHLERFWHRSRTPAASSFITAISDGLYSIVSSDLWPVFNVARGPRLSLSSTVRWVL